MISIAALIYKSVNYADALVNDLLEFTPKLKTGEAEFYFVANDPTDKLLKHLEKKNYKFFLNNNEKYSEEQLFKMGYGKPEYIHRVYRGWNFAIEKAQDIVVLVNSDNMFSPNWLENLLKHLTEKTIVSSQIVERTHPLWDIFPGVLRGEFGNTIKTYKNLFISFLL